MDAGERAELDALRRQAYGRGADIHDDPVALARLIELEDLARPTMPDPAPEPRPTEDRIVVEDRIDVGALEPDGVSRAVSPAGAAAGGTTAERATVSSAVRVPRRRWGLRAVLFVSAAAAVTFAVAVALSQPSSGPSPFAQPTEGIDSRFIYRGDPGAETLLTVRLDGAFAVYADVPTDGSGPAFPATRELEWATPLGIYYGWHLWVAGGSGWADDEHCILIQRENDTRARCVTQAVQRTGKLRVELEASDISPEELPRPMDDDDSIRFWWLEDGQVDVVLGSFTAD